MRDNTGNKVSIVEYATRATINVIEKAAVPVITLGLSYVAYFHGHDISNWTRRKIQERKNRRDKK